MISRYLIAATFALSANFVLGNSGNPPNERAGDPPNSLNCRSCHSDGTLNNGDSNFTIVGLPSYYTPGRTYELSLLLDKNASGYGFQAIVKSGNNATGTLSAVSAGTTVDSGYVEHSTQSSTGNWTFKWTAPSTDLGKVTFYASGLISNSSATNAGDFVYTLSQDVNSSSSQNIPQVQDLAWSQPTRGAVYSSPTIGSDGTIYVGSGDKKLYAFYPDGGVKWTYEAGDWVDSTPAIGDDGTIYVGSWDNKLHAVNPDGTGKWSYSTDSTVEAGPAVGADGTIYVGSHDNFFYALEANGSEKWEYFAEQPISSSAAIGQDGTIYFGDDNGTFHAVNPDGTEKWTFQVDTVSETNGTINSSPALDLYGNIYFGSANGYCYSLEDNGSNAIVRWKYETGDQVDSSPVLGLSNEVFFMSRDGYLRSIDIDFGVANWEKPAGDVFYSSPVVDSNGTVYVVGYMGGGENHVFAIDANGSMDWNSSMTNHPVVIGDVVDSSLTIDSNGTLYFGSFDKKLYAIKVDSNLSDSDWPKFRRDNSGTGRWPSYQIDANASPNEGGIITGAGIYNEGANATIYANPSVGYAFDHWSGDGVFDPNEANTTVTMTQARSVTAHFERIRYTLNTSAGAGGSVTSSGVYDHGTDANITATPQTGYFFANWTGDGIADLNASTTTVDMTQERNATASFSINRHVLTVNAGTGGSASGSDTYDWNSSVSIEATPETGHHFVNWTGAVTDFTSTSTTVTMDQNRTVTANFAIDEHLLTLSAGTGGSVSDSDTHDYDTNASITATPDTGYHFVNWTGDGITDLNASTTTVNMTQDRNATATFAIDRHVLIVSKETGGTATGSETFDWNSSPTIVATVNTGYEFTGWTGAGVNDADALSTTVTMTQDRNVTATFAINSYALTTNTSAGGSVSASGAHDHGTQATITATSQTGYSFTSWSGAGIADLNASTTTVDMTQDRNVSANFVAGIHTLIVSATSGGAALGDGNFSYGTDTTITATAAAGYYFVNWSGAGIASSNSPTTTVSMTKDRNVTANFVLVPENQKILAVYADPIGSGSTNGSGPYDANSNVTLSASALAGYYFLGWTVSGGTLASPLSSTSATVTLDQGSDANATAHFAALSYELDLVPSTGGSVSGDANSTYGQNLSITATPDLGYSFAGWEVNGTLDFAVTTATRQYDTSAKAFYIDDKENPPLTLVRGNVYKFVLDGSTTVNHPLYFSTDSSGGGNFYAGEYLNGVINSQATSGTVSITVDEGTPSTLYYYCGNHSGMGNVISIIDATGLVTDANADTTTTDANASYVLLANFSLKQHTLTVIAGTGGSVSGGGTFDYGTNTPITATPAEGYAFSSWSGLDGNESSSQTTTVPMTTDRNVTANFELAPYALNLTSDPPTGGSTTGGGGYNLNEVAQITATPSTGYAFAGWVGGNPVDLNASSTTITIIGSANITAKFEKLVYDVQVTATPIGAGEVSGTDSYEHGATINLAATPIKGYEFSHWSGVSLTSPNLPSQAFAASGNLNPVANFERHADAGTLSYALDATELEAGWKESSWFGHFHQATPDWSYHFDFGWIYTKPEDNTSMWFWHQKLGWLWTNKEVYPHVWRDTQPLGAWTYFSRIPDGSFAYYDYTSSSWQSNLNIYEIQVVPYPSVGGTVSEGGSFEEGTVVTLTATPAEGYVFKRWFGDATAETSNLDVIVNGEFIIYAEFEKSSP